MEDEFSILLPLRYYVTSYSWHYTAFIMHGSSSEGVLRYVTLTKRLGTELEFVFVVVVVVVVVVVFVLFLFCFVVFFLHWWLQ